MNAPRSVEDRARELHALLLNGDVQAPYIFVAHSYGGLIVRHYFREYPSEVAGLVLVDTPDESSIFKQDVLSFYSKARILNRLVGVVAQFGVLRLLSVCVSLDRFGFWLSKPSEYAALSDDLASLDRVPAAMKVSERAGSLGSLPLTVITHGLPFPGPFAVLEQNWSEGQKQLASLSTDSVLIVAQNSNHMIQHDEPALVVDAIRRIHEKTERESRWSRAFKALGLLIKVNGDAPIPLSSAARSLVYKGVPGAQKDKCLAMCPIRACHL